MPIEFKCNCGRRLRVADDHAGTRARCPACKAVVPVPSPQAFDWDLRIAEESPPPQPAKVGGSAETEKAEERFSPPSVKMDDSPEPGAADCGLDLVEEDEGAEPAEDDCGLEVVEEAPSPTPVAPVALVAPAGVAPVADALPVTAPASEGEARGPSRADGNKK